MTMGLALVIGYMLTWICKPKDRLIYAKEGFVIVALAWMALSAVGALPFVISREFPHLRMRFLKR